MDNWATSMRRARKSRKMSLRRLSAEAGVSYNMLWKYEGGLSDPGLFNLVCLADTLEVGLDEYIGRTAPQKAGGEKK